MERYEISDQELIDKYIRHSLTDQEDKLFHEKLKEDSFKELLQTSEDIAEELGKIGKQRLRNQFSSWYNEPSSPKKNYRNIYWLSTAASILIGISLLLFLNTRQSLSKLADIYYAIPPDYISQVKRGEQPNENKYLEVMKPYLERNWTEAKNNFQDYLDKNSRDYKVMFYQGITVMELKDYPQAIVSFSKVMEYTEDPTFVHPAQWYSALCYLKTKQKELAITLLREIRQTQDHYKAIDANYILVQLQSE